MDTVSFRLCRFREGSSRGCRVGGLVSVRCDLADRGVPPSGVVAVRPPEHGPVGGGLVRERGRAFEELALERGVDALRQGVVGARAHRPHGLGHLELSWTSLVSLTDSEVVEEFLCLGADFGGGGDLLAADLDGDVS